MHRQSRFNSRGQRFGDGNSPQTSYNMSDASLRDQIYEAAFVPELWSDALASVAASHGCAAGAIGAWDASRTPLGFRSTPLTRAAVAGNMPNDGATTAARFHALHAVNEARFTCVETLFPAHILDADPIQQSLRAVGLESQAATAIAMPNGELVCISFERFKADGAFDGAALAALGLLRPHFARAGLVAARLGLARAEATVAAMRNMGLAAAVLTLGGRVLTTNALFEAMATVFLPSSLGGIAINDAGANQLFQDVLTDARLHREPIVRSIPITASATHDAVVIHILPLRRAAHEIFSGGELLIVATAVRATAMVPGPAILMGLFDLTPAEVKLATVLASGRSVQHAAREAGVTLSSARTYLDRIFKKTGTHQQSQLVALLKSAQPFPGAG